MKPCFFILTLLLLATTLLTACKKSSHCNNPTEDEKNCVSYTKAAVIKVEGAVSAIVHNETPLTVFFSCSNGCGQFERFEETIVGTTITIDVIAKYEGCTCTMDIPVRQAVYKFKPGIPLTYTLKFRQLGNTFYEHIVAVK